MIGFGFGLFIINLLMLRPIFSACKAAMQSRTARGFVYVGIGAANIPGAFVFWLRERKKTRFHAARHLRSSVDAELIFIVLIMIYEWFAVLLADSRPEMVWIKPTLLMILLLLFLLHDQKEIGQVSQFFLSMIIIAGVVVVNQWAGSSEYKISIIVVTVAVLNEYPLAVAKRFAFVPLVLYMGLSSVAMRMIEAAGFKAIAIFAIRNAITYGMIVCMFYIGKKQLLIVEELKRTTLELYEKNQRMEEVRLMRERNRIAREIHDTLGHTLTGAIIQLEAAKKMIPVDQDKAVQIIERTQEVTREGFADVKRAIRALRPILIEESSLQEALHALTERVQTEYGVTVNLEMDEALVLEDKRKIALYRMMQEGITNSMRHGEASKIQIGIQQKQNSVRLVLEDDGIGCSHVVEGYGLKGIRERVEQLNGEMVVKSAPKKGFMIMICIPQHA